MSSWVKVTRSQVQKPVVDKSINPYRPYQKSPYSPQDGYSKDFEDLNSFEELFGQQYDYSTGNEDYYERYQYSQKAGPSLHETPGIPRRQESAVAAQQPGSSRRQDLEHESSAMEVGPTTPCSRDKWRTASATSVAPPAGVSPLPVVVKYTGTSLDVSGTAANKKSFERSVLVFVGHSFATALWKVPDQ